MDLVFSSTIELAAAIRGRKISAVEALDAHLAEIDRQNEAVTPSSRSTGKGLALERRKPTKPRRAATLSGRSTVCRSR